VAKAVIRKLTEELQRLERAIIPFPERRIIILDRGRYRLDNGRPAPAPGDDDILITIVAPQARAA
jgi:hypothetical protein